MTGIFAIALGLGAFLALVALPLFSPLRKIPGPVWTRWTDLWYLIKTRSGHYENTIMSLHEKHGPVVRYGPNRYSFTDPNAVHAIYNHRSQFPKSTWYDVWAPPGKATSIFADRSIPRHAANRRLYQPAFTMSSLLGHEALVDECEDLFAMRLDEFAKAGVAMDMGYWLQCFAFDVIGMITYGKRLGFLDRGEDVGGVIHALEMNSRYTTAVGIYPYLHPVLYKLWNMLYGGVGRDYVVKFTVAQVAAFSAEPKAVKAEGAKEPFLARFMAQHEENPEQFTKGHVIAGCVANMIAGSESTSTSFAAILFCLLKNPDCMEKLRAELETLEFSKNSRDLTFKETQDLTYLDAVIKEAMRVYPAAGWPLERVVPEGGAVLCDQQFPAGTIVSTDMWALHRSKEAWGPEAEGFRPERWLTADKEKLAEMDRAYMPFGGGARHCIGKHVSLMEMKKLLPRLLRDFDFEIEGQNDDFNRENFWAVKPKGFMLKVKTRESG